MQICVKIIILIASSLMLLCCGGGGGGNKPSSSSIASSIVVSSPTSNNSAASSSQSNVVSGLANRPGNKTCMAPVPIVSGSTTISWSAIFPSLPNIVQATNLIQSPDDNSVWYALRQSGIVVRFPNQSSANTLTTVLDIEDRVDFNDSETGLLGIAFHPQFASNRYVYFYYMGRNQSNGLESRVARYRFLANGDIDKNSEFILLRFDQPFSNHNGGQLAFGKDGFLYISAGDGGSGGDPQQNGQNKNNLLGKILRIDVDSSSAEKNYGIPGDNPFASGGGSPEIWAYGLRNPWRFSFDKETGELWAGDVGQGAWEEVNVITRGGNYGWGDMEGDTCYSGRPNCSTTNKIRPVLSISHNTGVCSIIGGFVYRGSQYPAAYGKYFYTDFCINTMQSITRTGENVNVASHGDVPVDIVSFAQDNQGELYAIGQRGAGSQIVKLQATGGSLIPGTMAQRLSATGCVDAANPRLPSTAMIPYNVETQLWSDSATKERYLALPDNTKIDLASDGDFLFPVGSVLLKHFKLGDKYIETRLFARGQLGWQGFSYEWRDDQTDATLLADGKEKTIDTILWQYPSPAQCLVCHTQAANFSLGLETLQLNASMNYSGISANQLDTLAHIQLFSSAMTTTQKAQKLFPLDHPSATLAQRARSYLHSNCSGCHRPAGVSSVNLDLRFSSTLTAMNACDARPMVEDLGIANARLIAPGEPARSVLLARMKVRNGNQMPTLGTHLVDEAAVQVVSDWISGLTGCE
ncbi:hypothetical protein D0C16_00860 [Cellvibrio sp. KY-GH-1]|uniref:PQQ-dependent sugar dehydrogenase n=1 Tax=Cellvibrio sp. KY-GH-1 TaxID=2303332 RepID=UPI001244FA78|nr:PQQ-dependent sugar dehydrogenase [Cellvibrio sp. KY-GH-1]QEY14656.1 hypothetical protein D0C16_00860 [Cellvibrio sp. KY-GH-1]